jgi:hypothetical protein
MYTTVDTVNHIVYNAQYAIQPVVFELRYSVFIIPVPVPGTSTKVPVSVSVSVSGT